MPLNQIFSGVTTAPCRDFVAECIIKEKPSKVYMPCCGRFVSSQAFIEHGGNPDILYSSDINLYTSLLGYLFDESKSIKELGVVNNSVIQPKGDDEIQIAAAVMLAIKYGQIAPTNKHNVNIRKEIMSHVDQYLQKMEDKLSEVVGKMKGSHYDIADMWDVIGEAKQREDACIFLNVPMYKGGYEKMFANSGVSWNEPNIAQFSPDFYDQMIASLADAKCSAFVYSQRNLDHIPDEWQTIYAQPYDIDRTDYVVSNHKIDSVYAVSSVKNKPHKLYPVYDDSDITPESKVEFVQVDEPTVMYYRDLFVHKLGTTTAEAFYLMLIDGKVVTALGLIMRDVFTMKSQYVSEVFGISKSSDKYKRLGKLFMLCLTSGDTANMLRAKYKNGIFEIKGVKTSSLTTYAEGKTDRSVMHLIHREQLENGTYRVIYIGDFRDDTYSDCIKTWLDRWGGKRR